MAQLLGTWEGQTCPCMLYIFLASMIAVSRFTACVPKIQLRRKREVLLHVVMKCRRKNNSFLQIVKVSRRPNVGQIVPPCTAWRTSWGLGHGRANIRMLEIFARSSRRLKARPPSTRDGRAKAEEKQQPFAPPNHLIAVPFLMLVRF